MRDSKKKGRKNIVDIYCIEMARVDCVDINPPISMIRVTA